MIGLFRHRHGPCRHGEIFGIAGDERPGRLGECWEVVDDGGPDRKRPNVRSCQGQGRPLEKAQAEDAPVPRLPVGRRDSVSGPSWSPFSERRAVAGRPVGDADRGAVPAGRIGRAKYYINGHGAGPGRQRSHGAQRALREVPPGLLGGEHARARREGRLLRDDSGPALSHGLSAAPSPRSTASAR